MRRWVRRERRWAAGAGSLLWGAGQAVRRRRLRVLAHDDFELVGSVWHADRSADAERRWLAAKLQESVLHRTAKLVELARAVPRRLIDTFARGAPQPPSVTGALAQLTRREREVLPQIASGLTDAEIGAELGVTTGTVKTHVNALLSKLGLRDRVQAAILAYESGLVRARGTPTP